MSNIDHPFYCIGCGVIQKDKDSFDEHYRKCWLQQDELSKEQIFDLVYNENNY